jgi:glycerophosphoryl diester phosphodiesterase
MNWTQFRQERKTRRRPLIIAHRGARTVQPENTLLAFDLALRQGADGLETDLHFTRDGEIVLFHDATLDRMTDGTGPVGAQTLAELKRLRTRAPAGHWSDAPIPTLAELIDFTGAQTPLLLELKDRRFAERAYAQRLIQLLEQTNMVERSAIVSFHAEYVASVEAIQPAIPTGLITLKNPLPTGKAQLLGPLWPLIFLNPVYVPWAHRLGKIVAPLDPTPEPRIRAYRRLRVDALLADNPATVVAALEASERQNSNR